MNLKVIGAGCPECDKLYTNTLEAVEQLQLDAKVEKIENLVEIVADEGRQADCQRAGAPGRQDCEAAATINALPPGTDGAPGGFLKRIHRLKSI